MSCCCERYNSPLAVASTDFLVLFKKKYVSTIRDHTINFLNNHWCPFTVYIFYLCSCFTHITDISLFYKRTTIITIVTFTFKLINQSTSREWILMIKKKLWRRDAADGICYLLWKRYWSMCVCVYDSVSIGSADSRHPLNIAPPPPPPSLLRQQNRTGEWRRSVQFPHTGTSLSGQASRVTAHFLHSSQCCQLLARFFCRPS